MLSLTTNIKHFPFSKVQKFYNIIHDDWKDIAVEILNRDKSGPRFTWDDIRVFERSSSPPKEMFDAWKTDNITFQDVISVLEKAKKERAVTFIKHSVLNLKKDTDKPLVNEEREKEIEESNDSIIVSYKQLCKWTNNFNGIKISNGGSFISSGGFADVYRGVKGQTFVAVKRFKSVNDNDLITQFDNEIAILTQCMHPNLLRLLHYCKEFDHLCLVYEYMENGSLYDYLMDKTKLVKLQFKRRLNIFRQCTEGLDYLHKRNIIHRDIKSANILLDGKMDAKLGDFGITRSFSTDCGTHIHTNTLIGTMLYMAPEYMSYGEVSHRIDMYSMGIVLVELLTGFVALDEGREIKSVLEIIEEEFIPDANLQDCAIEVFNTLKQLSWNLLSKQKAVRPNAEQVLKVLESCNQS